MLDYKKILETENWDNAILDISKTDNCVEIGGNKKGLLRFVCMLAEFVVEECDDKIAETNFDQGIDTTENSPRLCVYFCKNWENPMEN